MSEPGEQFYLSCLDQLEQLVDPSEEFFKNVTTHMVGIYIKIFNMLPFKYQEIISDIFDDANALLKLKQLEKGEFEFFDKLTQSREMENIFLDLNADNLKNYIDEYNKEIGFYSNLSEEFKDMFKKLGASAAKDYVLHQYYEEVAHFLKIYYLEHTQEHQFSKAVTLLLDDPKYFPDEDCQDDNNDDDDPDIPDVSDDESVFLSVDLLERLDEIKELLDDVNLPTEEREELKQELLSEDKIARRNCIAVMGEFDRQNTDVGYLVLEMPSGKIIILFYGNNIELINWVRENGARYFIKF